MLLDPAQRPVIVENIPIRRESEFRAWLPIMYGCDNFLSLIHIYLALQTVFTTLGAAGVVPEKDCIVQA